MERKNDCRKCEMLAELYNNIPKSDRDYWMMTELFVMLHGSDVCKKGRTDGVIPQKRLGN